MKKVFSVAALAALVALSSCGGGADKEAERKKREADSLAKLEQARQDSIKNAQPVLTDIVMTASANADFSTLVSLLDKAGLAATLKDTTKNFTVFAPTNAAFDALGAKTLEDLQKPANVEKLKNTLLYHVVDGKKMAADVLEATELFALNGKKIVLSKSEAGNMVANAHLGQTDIDCKNGVIHVIDAVMTDDAKAVKASGNKGNSGTSDKTNGKTGNETTDKTNDKLNGKQTNNVQDNTNSKLNGKQNNTVEDKTNSKLKK